MNESFRFEAKAAVDPTLDTVKDDLELDVPLVEMHNSNESHQLPALVESNERFLTSVEQVQSTYDEVFTEPIAIENTQIEALQRESEEVKATVSELEGVLPNVAGEEVRSLTQRLNDLDRTRISLLQREVFVADDIAFRKKEAEAFKAERDQILDRLTSLLTELIMTAKKELERARLVTDVHRSQVHVNKEEARVAFGQLKALEENIKTLQAVQESEGIGNLFDDALIKIARSREKLLEQEQEELVELERLESETILIEDRIGQYEAQHIGVTKVREQLMIEDMRDLKNEAPEEFIDAEFEVINGPTPLAIEDQSGTSRAA